MRKPAGLLPALAAAAGCWLFTSPAAAISYDDYHSSAEVQTQLDAWAKAHSEIKLLTIGKSAGGRPIVVARIAAGGSAAAGDPDQRPD